MIRAFLVGGFASSSLLLGAVVSFVRPIKERTLGLVMAFGAGVLISAVAYDLVASAVERWRRSHPVGAGCGSDDLLRR